MRHQLNARVEGVPGATPLLLLHGFLSSNLQWEPNLDGLRPWFRLIGVELWGHGGSPVPNDPAQWRIAHYLEQFEAIRATLGITRWLVCGQSFGAGIMIRYACSHSDAVAGLVITNSRSAIAEDLARDRPQRGLAAWRAISPASLPFHPRHARRFPPALQRRMEAAADRVNAETLWRSTMITAPELCSRALLPEIPVPTLLVNGRWETAFQADRDHAARTVPDITVADLDGGHSVNIEAPGDFNAALQAFAARCI